MVPLTFKYNGLTYNDSILFKLQKAAQVR